MRKFLIRWWWTANHAELATEKTIAAWNEDPIRCLQRQVDFERWERNFRRQIGMAFEER